MYDDLFRKVAREAKLDWRLVSAIAFSESKYNPYLVSPRGARGLMQVMPATARAFDVPVDQLMDPEANVRVAVALIREIEKSLKFSPASSSEDRTYIMLACYNAGIGYVLDARRLAVKYGGNPDSWSEVARYLRLKAEPKYAEDPVVQCGPFKGAGETLRFVEHVMGKYYAYLGK
ncbi:MAG: transglycosylase SLT domain-containing protein [Rikenellaceae bacterium]|nr:transglycosylase SLT domain-containing protein [Rikenellaceae bacterium]